MVEARNQLAEYARALKTEYDRFIEDAKLQKQLGSSTIHRSTFRRTV